MNANFEWVELEKHIDEGWRNSKNSHCNFLHPRTIKTSKFTSEKGKRKSQSGVDRLTKFALWNRVKIAIKDVKNSKMAAIKFVFFLISIVHSPSIENHSKVHFVVFSCKCRHRVSAEIQFLLHLLFAISRNNFYDWRDGNCTLCKCRELRGAWGTLYVEVDSSFSATCMWNWFTWRIFMKQSLKNFARCAEFEVKWSCRAATEDFISRFNLVQSEALHGVNVRSTAMLLMR